MNVNNGTYYNYYQDKRNHAPVRTIRKKARPIEERPIGEKLDLLQEITMMANRINERLKIIEQLGLQ